MEGVEGTGVAGWGEEGMAEGDWEEEEETGGVKAVGKVEVVGGQEVEVKEAVKEVVTEEVKDWEAAATEEEEGWAEGEGSAAVGWEGAEEKGVVTAAAEATAAGTAAAACRKSALTDKM